MLFIKQISSTRSPWLLLLLFILFFEGSALFFQHGLHLGPCVMCIYERVAMMGIGFAAILGLINPSNIFIRWSGLIGWGISAGWGLKLAMQHVDYQFNPSPFATCDLFVQFPSWAPLNQWVPWMFEATGDCSKVVWMFVNLSMPQWLVIIFAANLLALAIVMLGQVIPKRK